MLRALQDPAMRAPIAISLGAIAGALMRYYLSLSLIRWLGPSFPYGTLCVNLLGSWLMGVFVAVALLRESSISPEIRLLVTVGFLGSLTTFSTYTLDTLNLMRDRSLLLALGYWAGSALLGMVSLYGGILTVRWLSP
jgi:CrcB protein